MKELLIHIGAGTANRHLGFNGVTANGGRRPDRISLACAFLVMAGGLAAQAGTEAAYKLFGREVGGYASNDDVPGIVAKELGPRASVADWEEIKRQFGQSEASLKAFCEKLGLGPEGSAWVTRGRERFWQGSPRGYFLYRADHKKPEDFMVHDQLQNDFLLLGSWTSARPVLVKITDFSTADAAKFGKWDEILAAKSKADISGVYALVTVNGLKLPAKISHEGADLEVRAGTFTITADGKCASKMTFLPPSGREATVNTRATYKREGPTLTMQWEGAGGTSGRVEGNTFTMENEGMVFVYSKSAGTAKSARIGATEAKDHYNESLTVTGQVAQVSFRPTIVYLNLDKPYPETPFAAVIFAKDTNSFGDLSGLKGKSVEVQGTIKEYRGKPEIVLEHTNQLVVVGGR